MNAMHVDFFCSLDRQEELLNLKASTVSCTGVYLHDSQIKTPTRAAEDMEMAAELWKETEKQLAEAEKKLSA
jgi:hypothetical protein